MSTAASCCSTSGDGWCLTCGPSCRCRCLAASRLRKQPTIQPCATKLQAALLLLELEDTDPAADEICDELRRRLKLESPQPIDPEVVDTTSLRLARFARLAVERLSDAQLAQAFQRTAAAGYESALRRLAQEAVRRSKLAGDIKLAAYQYLAQFEEDAERAQSHLAEAQPFGGKAPPAGHAARPGFGRTYFRRPRALPPDRGAAGAKLPINSYGVRSDRILGFLRWLEVIAPQEVRPTARSAAGSECSWPGFLYP